MANIINNINLSELSLEELKTLRSRINSEMNYRSHQTLIENKNTISVGDHITVDNAKTHGKIFRVTSMRRTKASIENIKNSRESYTLPISMMVKSTTSFDLNINDLHK
tara:strand:- start:184 stop:507 length:324 start_codon:yes stop_codon:yes gene_type:complete